MKADKILKTHIESPTTDLVDGLVKLIGPVGWRVEVNHADDRSGPSFSVLKATNMEDAVVEIVTKTIPDNSGCFPIPKYGPDSVPDLTTLVIKTDEDYSRLGGLTSIFLYVGSRRYAFDLATYADRIRSLINADHERQGDDLSARKLRLFVVGASTPDPAKWGEWGSRALVWARDKDEAVRLVGDLPLGSVATEVDLTEPTLLMYQEAPRGL